MCSDYDLCVPCFGEGSSTKDHQPARHQFKVIEQHSIPIYAEEWGADEELALIEGAETYGLGSWADIADHIGGYRQKDEVRDHYIDTYINSPRFPLPERAALDDTRLSTAVPREAFQARKKRRIEERKEAAANASPTPPKHKPTASVPACHEVAGFMPGRLEFESEYFNEAEEAVQHMSFDPTEGIDPVTNEVDPEMELKLKVMEIYNSRLTQRVERKKIIFEHELLEYKRNQALERKRSKEEKDLFHKCKPFARMMQRRDFDTFYDGLAYEQNLRQAITQLQEWHKMGIGDLAAGEKYEQEKHARANRAPPGVAAFDRLSTSRMPKATPPVETGSTANALVAPELPAQFKMGLHTPPGSQSPSGKPLTNGHHAGATSNGTNGILTPASNTQGPSAISTFTLNPVPGCTPLSPSDPSWQAAGDKHLLLEDEKKLCRVLRIHPKPYTKLKERVLLEAARQGGTLKKKVVREMCGLEGGKGNRLFEYWAHGGWLGKG